MVEVATAGIEVPARVVAPGIVVAPVGTVVVVVTPAGTVVVAAVVACAVVAGEKTWGLHVLVFLKLQGLGNSFFSS